MDELKETEFSRQVFENISTMESQIEEAEEELKRRKAALQEYVIKTIKRASPEDVAVIAPVLYWLHTTHVNADAVKVALGLKHKKSSHRSEILHSFGFTMQCHYCGEIAKIHFTSRADYLDSLKNAYRHPMCDNCRLKKEQEREKPFETFEESSMREARHREYLRTMPYYEYLQTDHWKETRKAALKRAYFRCQVCNTNERTLHVHHRTYENRGREWPSDLIVLCESCHQTFHDNGILS